MVKIQYFLYFKKQETSPVIGLGCLRLHLSNYLKRKKVIFLHKHNSFERQDLWVQKFTIDSTCPIDGISFLIEVEESLIKLRYV